MYPYLWWPVFSNHTWNILVLQLSGKNTLDLTLDQTLRMNHRPILRQMIAAMTDKDIHHFLWHTLGPASPGGPVGPGLPGRPGSPYKERDWVTTVQYNWHSCGKSVPPVKLCISQLFQLKFKTNNHLVTPVRNPSSGLRMCTDQSFILWKCTVCVDIY